MNCFSNIFIFLVSRPPHANEVLHFISTVFCCGAYIKPIKMKQEFSFHVRLFKDKKNLPRGSGGAESEKKTSVIWILFDPLENKHSNKAKQFSYIFLPPKYEF